MTELFDLEMGEVKSNAKVIVRTGKTENINFKDGSYAEKVIFECETENGQTMKISECWSKVRGENKVQGLWLKTDNNGNILPNSTLGKFLSFNNIEKLKDIKNKELEVFTDNNGYLVFTSFDLK